MAPVSVGIGRIRSALYVPGHRDRMVQKALDSEADCIYFDLEDSVPPEEKGRARSILAEAVSDLEDKVAFVRVNALDSHLTLEDVQAVYSPNLDGILLPKSNSAEAVLIADYLLSVAEGGDREGRGPVAIGVLAETASTIVNCKEILSASPRVASVSVGVAEDGDLQADVGYTRTGSRAELLYLMSHVLVVARSLGIGNVLSGPYAIYDDDDGLREEAAFTRDLGFTGKAAIHPRQLPIINEVFSYTPHELERFERIIAAMEEAGERGLAATTVDGRMVDIAMVKRARRLLDG